MKTRQPTTLATLAAALLLVALHPPAGIAMVELTYPSGVPLAPFKFTTGVKVVPDVEPFKGMPGASK